MILSSACFSASGSVETSAVSTAGTNWASWVCIAASRAVSSGVFGAAVGGGVDRVALARAEGGDREGAAGSGAAPWQAIDRSTGATGAGEGSPFGMGAISHGTRCLVALGVTRSAFGGLAREERAEVA